MNFFNLNEKYRSLIVSIVVLLALILSFLLVTIYTTQQTREDNLIIDATNQIAINTQSTLKDLFDLASSQNEDISSPHMKSVVTRIRQTVVDTDQLFNGLETGQSFTYKGVERELPAVTGEAATKLEELHKEWLVLSPVLQDYLKDVDNITIDSSKKLYAATSTAAVSSVVMDTKTNELLSLLAESTERHNRVTTAVQIIGIVVLFLYFAVFLTVFLRRLQKIDAELDVARQETTEIMQTVNTGLFLLDKDLRVGNQYSAALENIIGIKNIAGERLSTLLRNRISDKDLQTTEEFIDQLYKPHVKEKLVNSLNPLHKVMMHDGAGDSRYLDFKFSRVYEGSNIARILVNVNDVSEAVRLEQRLEKERSQNDRQIEMLTTILNVNPRVINEFIDNTYIHIEKINNVLKNPGSSQFELEGKLKSIYREMHSLKGEASALKLHSFTKIASEAEDKLHALQNQGKLAGNDFLPLTVQLDELLSLSNAIKELGDRINSAQQVKSNFGDDVGGSSKSHSSLSSLDDEISVSLDGESAAPAPVKVADAKAELGEYLVEFGKSIAERQNKQVHIDISQMAGVYIPKALSVTIKEVCIQLLRNAIVHGIDSSDVRAQYGKSPLGLISVVFKEPDENGDLVFSIEDDGQGINYDAIRQKLLDGGKYDAEQVAEMSEAQLLNMLFSSGFSTRAVADEDGGRGVGLDIVKDRIKEFGGKINVKSERERFTRFIIKLPVEQQ